MAGKMKVEKANGKDAQGGPSNMFQEGIRHALRGQ
jgi:hypothetical protein